MRYDYLPIATVIQDNWIDAVVQQLTERNLSRPVLMTSHSLATATPLVELLAERLSEGLVGQFTRVRAHTPRSDVLAALAQARAVKADCLLALGGGSVIDAAKAVQFALNREIRDEAELLQYARFADGGRGPLAPSGKKPPNLQGAHLRLFAIPTTLSGAEFSNNAGVLDETRQIKEGYRDWDLCPQVIVYDPAIGQYTPQWLWLSTAIRSLDHAVEGYCAPEVHPYLEAQFLHAMSLLAQSLPAAAADSADQQARRLNQQAVWSACSGLGRVSHGASHGIGYSLGSLCGLPHGYTSCVILPAVLEWNASVNGRRQEAIAAALGAPGGSAGGAVRDLVQRLGLPSTLQEAGVAKAQLAQIAQAAASHPVVQRNPRPINGPSDVMEILNLAW